MPIAIVGRGCVLPGALSPAQLWQRLQGGEDLLSAPPAGSWPAGSEGVTLDAAGTRWSDRGGYVRHFEFDPTGFAVDPSELLQADRCAHWVLAASRQALHEAGHDAAAGHRRTGAILGHLSLPTPLQARFAMAAWTRRWAEEQGLAGLIAHLDRAPVAPANRYMSAMPTRLLARSLGLGCEAFTLDAACASSLYAIKLACDALEDRRSDVMLAGASCGTDPMFLHIGFRALKALSPTGQSRPFHRNANGLVPSEGAVVLVLKRLADAEAAGDRVLGVIRGIGLSNDGGAAGLLTPASSGQVRSIRQALANAALRPGDVAMLECHATGTPVGDGVELASIGTAYGAAECMPIGSLKSQMGHLLTVSGAAGILKVLGAFESGVLPRSVPVHEPLDVLAQAPVRLLESEEPWPAQARRIAGVSSFGFGGNNAHILLEAHEPGRNAPLHVVRVPSAPAPATLAITGMGVVCAGAQDSAQFARSLLDGRTELSEVPGIGACGLAAPFELTAAEIRFPPRDLADSLPQQVILLKATSEALATVRSLPHDRTGVLTGMECDVEIARQLARELVPGQLREWGATVGVTLDDAWRQQARDAFVGPLKASDVTGSLPNIVANRLNAQYKLGGLGHSVCADELSGLRALDIAARALRRGELDAAVVSAVDLCCEPATAQAARSLEGPGRARIGDAAVVLILKRLDDARRDGDPVLALIDGESTPGDPGMRDDDAGFALGDGPGALQLSERYGHAHAASGLLHVAAAVIATRHGARLGSGPATPWPAPAATRRCRVSLRAQGGQPYAIDVRAASEETHPIPSSCINTSPYPANGIRFASHMPAIALPAWPQVPASPRPPTVPPPESAMNAHALAPPTAVVRPTETTAPRPLWSRADLEEMSHGQLSRFFGPKFKPQDGHARQVRMPMPPLLLADRVMAIEGEAGSMGLGRIVTETDITADAWYLHEGSMPAGLEVEAGQADLLLISYLGADLLNRGERVYRLLGCEMTFHGERRPRVGDTLRYEIEVTGHANTGDVRLFFFRYDSYLNGAPRLSVRNGRAGFFTVAELENAGGVIWNPATDLPDASIRHTAAPASQSARSYTCEQVRALAEGRAYDCFGAGFEMAAAHHKTPRVQEGAMQLFQQVEQLDPHGGPWGRGYLRATYEIRGDEWFFPGHFKNDPTMPGTLMCEAGVQMMSFYLAALGHTRERDGWTFELVPSVTFKAVCRGQVVPSSRHMSYEILVRGLEDGDCPTLWADVLLTVDGRKAFHGRNLGIRLTPGVPLSKEQRPALPAAGAKPAVTVDGFTFDQAAMLHCATGLPSLAFGSHFARFDGARNLPRLPAPPYQFMSRVTRCEGQAGALQIGSEVEIEYDIPHDAWYFQDNDGSTMPYAVLLEAALQPCGWLAAYMGVPLHCDTDLRFRNLDGNGTLLRPVFRADRILRTSVRCTSLARNGTTFIESFDVECHVGKTLVYTLKTVFGHFTAEALSEQKGLPASPAEREGITGSHGPVVDLRANDGTGTRPVMPRGRLLMLDRVTGFWPQGGAAGKGRMLAEFDVDPRAWFFKAHFYRDPVQPGSLGIEAMVQLAQHYMLERGHHSGMQAPRFEPLACGRALAWKYRGQVLTTNRRVIVELEVADEGRDAAGPWMSANAWLWVDGMRIYHTRGLTVRLVAGGAT